MGPIQRSGTPARATWSSSTSRSHDRSCVEARTKAHGWALRAVHAAWRCLTSTCTIPVSRAICAHSATSSGLAPYAINVGAAVADARAGGERAAREPRDKDDGNEVLDMRATPTAIRGQAFATRGGVPQRCRNRGFLAKNLCDHLPRSRPFAAAAVHCGGRAGPDASRLLRAHCPRGHAANAVTRRASARARRRTSRPSPARAAS